jgi:methanogenic corrinoid protein MtbC1
MPERFFTPKQVAQAIGVSESSLKRWCNKGLLDASRTAGKHRRLALPEVIQFLRSQGQQLAHPELLGLPPTTGQGTTSLSRARTEFEAGLRQGDEQICRRVALNLFLAGWSLDRISDELFAPAMHSVGILWECNTLEIYQERRACEMIERCLHELRLALPSPSENAPLAIGAAPSGDPYRLPTAIVEAVFRELGWRSQNLGSNLPFESLIRAVIEIRPRVFWLSVSAIEEERRFLTGYDELYQECDRLGVAIVCGGVALTADLRRKMHASAFCDKFSHLVGYVRSLKAPGE